MYNDFGYKLLKYTFFTSFIGGPIIGIFQFITGKFVYNYMTQQKQSGSISYMMFSAVSANTNYASVHFLIVIFLAVVFYLNRKKVIDLLACIIAVICLVLTFSRGSLISLCMIIFIALLNKRKKIDNAERKKRKKIYIQIISVLIVLLLIGLLFADRFVEIFGDYFNNSYAYKNILYKLSSQGADSRVKIWNTIVEIMSTSDIKHWLLGYGDGYTAIVGKRIWSNEISAHNYILEQFIMCGITGLIVAIVFYANVFKCALKFINGKIYMIRPLGYLMVCLLVNYFFVARIDFSFLTVLLLALSMSVNELKVGGIYE